MIPDYAQGIVSATFNGKTTHYVVVDGTYYPRDTNPDVIAVLERVRGSHTRIRIAYGDQETGRDWDSEGLGVVEMGYVGRTMGPIKESILVCNRRSLGGGILMTDSLVRIATARGNHTLWQHPSYHRTTPEQETMA